MYEKELRKGRTVEWTYTDNLAEKAMELTDGTGVPNDVTLPDEANVPVEADVARNVRRAYRWLEYVAEYDGEDKALDYDDREELRDRYEELVEEHETDDTSE